MKPFLTNKGFIGNNDITHIHKNKIISDEKQLTKLLIRPVALNQKPLPQILKTPAYSLLEMQSILTKIIHSVLKSNK